jgi:hypothetical protein
MERRDSRTLTVFGRLRPLHRAERAARSEMSVIARRLADAYPATNKDIGVVVQNFNDRFNGGETARLPHGTRRAQHQTGLPSAERAENAAVLAPIDRGCELEVGRPHHVTGPIRLHGAADHEEISRLDDLRHAGRL